MAFPPRPPLMPGVPVSAMVGTPFTLTTNLVPAVRIPPMSQPSLSSIPTPMSARPPMRQMIQTNPPPMPPRPPLPGGNPLNKPPSYSQRIESSGPAVTVFVGNITERAPDVMIRHILNACGPVLSWKRVQGASGKLQGFGFCEYGNPDAALRAIRLLHEYDIASSKLVVKADSKTTEVLNEYKEKRKRAQSNNENSSPLQDEKKGDDDLNDDYMDKDMKAEDKTCVDRINMILSDHKKDIINYIPPQSRQDMRDKRMSRVQEKLVALSSGADIANIPSTLNLDDMDDVEEGKRELISREITQFREQMKKQEEEKERERKLKEKDRERDKERSKEREKERDRDREKEREREHERERERERREREERRRKSRSLSRGASAPRKSRSPPNDARWSRKEKHHSRSSPMSKTASWDRRMTPSESVRRSHSPPRKSDKDLLREKERDAEEKEKKEQERKVRKKEMQYQERLKNWEGREHKKQKELDREVEREKSREVDRERDARRLKEFLEDYDDERDDHKYYKGHAFQRKLLERDHEKEMDTKDRVKEKEELEELKAKILSEGHENPEEAYEQACQEREEQYKPKLLLKPAEKPVPTSQPPSQVSSPQGPLMPREGLTPAGDTNNHSRESESEEDSPRSDAPPEPEPMDENSLSRDAFSSAETTPQAPKRKKFDVKDVFNQDDDDAPQKKKKLPLPDWKTSQDDVIAGKDKGKEKGGEEKRKHIKSLIDKIPTSKAELFAYPIDASLVDNTLMEKRIRPWINKKIIEYIGEPEPSLVDFICSKVLVGSEPQSLLNDVQMVLDDEAEVFVVKMWRLLIYEIEAKKMGLGKS